MIDHCGIKVAPDVFDDVVKFYVTALEPLGYKKLHDYGGFAVGLGAEGPDGSGTASADFWIGKGESSGAPQHFGFRANGAWERALTTSR